MIRSRGLQFAYPSGPALVFPDVDVPQGGVLLLQGRSGTGKSTWLALVAGLRCPSAGELLVAGQSLCALTSMQTDAWRGRHIGFLPQQLHLSAALSVRDNLSLAYFAAGLPVDQEAINRILNLLGVVELADRRPAQLSGGQAQRVALARAVLLQPQVLLVDEPTASLDDDSAQAALRLLQETAQGLPATLVIATHDARVRHVLPQALTLQLGHSLPGPATVGSASLS